MATPPSQEPPLYVLPQVKARAVIPAFISLFILGTILYLGVLLNLTLLQLDAQQKTTIKIVFLVFLAGIILLGIITSLRRSRQAYYFYPKMLQFQNQQLPYSAMTNITSHQNFLDKLFKTYSLNVGEKFIIHHISQQVQLQPYVEQLCRYAQQG